MNEDMNGFNQFTESSKVNPDEKDLTMTEKQFLQIEHNDI